MKTLKGNDSFVIKIPVGEEIMASLKEFMRQEKLPSASFTGIGSIEKCVIGYFDRDQKKYLTKTIDAVCEITTLIGNLGWDENDEPMIHAHITLGFPDYHIEGGHLVEGVIGVVGEIVVIPGTVRIVRKKDDQFGLMLMS
ncbi:DNA-binding protein [bacterium]|nr:DNA-binding protein [bacterium]